MVVLFLANEQMQVIAQLSLRVGSTGMNESNQSARLLVTNFVLEGKYVPAR